jgi:c-di-GMP-binding flagellar brake protein YcgR
VAVTASAPAIPVGRHVQVSLPHIGLLPATVEAVEPGAVIVTLAVTDTRVRRLGAAEVGIEYKTERGIQRFNGTLELDDRTPDRLRVAVLGEAERIQRREWARVAAVVPVRIKGIDEPVDGETTTLNLSGGGILVRDLWQMPLGIDVRVELEPEPGMPPIRFLGRVVRVAGKDEKGIRIDDIGRDDEERLVRVVRDRERAALRTARTR